MVLLLLMPTKLSSAVESPFYELEDNEIQDFLNKVLERPED